MVVAPSWSVTAIAQQADGERLYKQRCAGCHSLDEGRNGAGPHLSGVIGRLAGSVEGGRYSEALKNSGIVWDQAAIDAYIANPRKSVPGTRMTIKIANPAQRTAIIDYIENH